MWEVAGGILSTLWGLSTGASLLWHEGMLVFPPGAYTSAVNPTTKSTFRETGLVSETVESSSRSVLLVGTTAGRKLGRALQSFFAALRSSSNTKRRTRGSSSLARDGPSTDERRAAGKLFEDRQVTQALEAKLLHGPLVANRKYASIVSRRKLFFCTFKLKKKDQFSLSVFSVYIILTHHWPSLLSTLEA